MSDGRFLHVTTLDNTALWRLDTADASITTNIVPSGQIEGARFRFPLMQVGPSLMLAQVEHTAGYGAVLIDVQARTVRPLHAHLPPGVPLALATREHTPHLITLDWPQQDTAEAWRPAVIAVTLDGQQMMSALCAASRRREPYIGFGTQAPSRQS